MTIRFPTWLLFFLVGFLMLSYTAVSLSAPNTPDPDPTTIDNGELRAQQRQAQIQDQQAPQNLPALSNMPCVNGMAGNYPCHEVDLLAFMPLATIGGGNGNDIWGWTDPLDGSEYAIMGRTNGTAFVDISDPYNPVYLGNLPTHSSNSTWRDIKVYKNHAFIVSEGSNHGMQIFDLTQLRNVNFPPMTFSNTAHYNGFSRAHNIVINEDSGYAYAVGTNTCAGGLHMVDINAPAAPLYAGCFSTDGYTHDAQCVIYNGPDEDYQGQEVCFNSNENTLTIVDVTSKFLPVQLSRTSYLGQRYTHQGWLTEDHAYFLLNDELDEMNNGHNTRTYIWDVQDLNAPVLLGSHLSTAAAIDHNLYVLGNYVYQANYRAGLRILELTDLAGATMTEVGYFDIYPLNNNASFNGAWSNYPYFESGTIIVSGIEQGLFVLRATNVEEEPAVAIDLQKTVGLGMMGEECPTAVHLTLPPGGGEVHYCYAVTNSGEVTLTTHSLVDDQLGTLLLDEPYELAPGAQFVVTATAVVTDSLISSATWTASSSGGITTTATAGVTLTVPKLNDSLTLLKTVGLAGEDAPDCPSEDTLQLPVGGGEVTHCYHLFNQGNITLTMHSVVDDLLGLVWEDETYQLLPGESVWTTATAVITESVVSGAIWTASYQGSPITATAVATITVTPTIYDFQLSSQAAISGTVGTAVSYTLHLTNSGNITDSYAISLTNGWGTSSDWLDPVSLATGQSITLTVTITVPEGVEHGTQDLLTVMVRSLGDEALMMERVFTTTAVVPPTTIYLPLITR